MYVLPRITGSSTGVDSLLFHPGTWSLIKRYLNKSVMFKGKNKYEVSDPAFYDSLIAGQKKQACRNSNDAMEWVKLVER